MFVFLAAALASICAGVSDSAKTRKAIKSNAIKGKLWLLEKQRAEKESEERFREVLERQRKFDAELWENKF